MTVNYQENSVDLDNIYINANDEQYFPLEQLNITGRKVVVVGQNYQSSYPTGNVGNAFLASNLNIPKIDRDSVNILNVLPTAVIYQDRTSSYHLTRSRFDLLENYPQTDGWLVGTANHSSPVQIGIKSNWSNVFTGDSTGVIDKQNNLWMCGYNRYNLLGTGSSNAYYQMFLLPILQESLIIKIICMFVDITDMVLVY